MTAAEALAAVRTLVQDPDDGTPVFSDALINQFLAEGVHRLSGFHFVLVSEVVTSNSTNVYDLTSVLSATPNQVVSVLSLLESLSEWEVFGTSLYFSDSPSYDFTVRYAKDHADVTTLPAALADACVYYASGRCLQWLVTRGGAQRQLYLARSGELVADEVTRLGEAFVTEYYALREEHAISTAVVF